MALVWIGEWCRCAWNFTCRISARSWNLVVKLWTEHVLALQVLAACPAKKNKIISSTHFMAAKGGCSKESTGPHLVDLFISFWLLCHQFLLGVFSQKRLFQILSWKSHLNWDCGFVALSIVLCTGLAVPSYPCKELWACPKLLTTHSEHLEWWRFGIRSWH